MKEAEQRKAQEAPHLLRSVASPCSLGRLPKQLHPLSIGGWMGESLHGPPLREASGKMCSVRRCLRYRGVGACAGRVSCCSGPLVLSRGFSFGWSSKIHLCPGHGPADFPVRVAVMSRRSVIVLVSFETEPWAATNSPFLSQSVLRARPGGVSRGQPGGQLTPWRPPLP